MDKKSVFVGFMALFLFGAGSASVLSSFGSISGTADVKPALRITGVNASGSEMEYVNFTVDASTSVSTDRIYVSNEDKKFDSVSGKDAISSGEEVLVTSDEINSSEVSDKFGSSVTHLTTNSSTVGGALTDSGGTVHLKIDDTVVDSFSYGGAHE